MSNKTAFYFRHWPLTENCRGYIMLVHGLGEHCERYQALAEYANKAGYGVYSMDLPGHGQSPGKRGHIDRFEEFDSAAMQLHDRIKEAAGDLPIYLVGHSMGGLIASHLLLNHQSLFAAAVLSGAAIKSPQTPPAFQVAILRFLSFITPKLGVMTLDASGISKDPEVVDVYMKDPLVNKGKLSARMAAELFGAMDLAQTRAAEITLPLCLLHGSNDVMTAPEGSELLHERISSENKKLTIYPGLFHEIFNEPEHEQVFADMIAWLNAHPK